MKIISRCLITYVALCCSVFAMDTEEKPFLGASKTTISWPFRPPTAFSSASHTSLDERACRGVFESVCKAADDDTLRDKTAIYHLARQLFDSQYAPAIVWLSDAFQRGKYGFPKDESFAFGILHHISMEEKGFMNLVANDIRIILGHLTEGKRAEAAEILGITESTLRDFLSPSSLFGGGDFPRIVDNFKKYECFSRLMPLVLNQREGEEKKAK